ncbi:RHS repeat-associated core domain-containing protein [Pseudomonas sp. GW101-3H06]|jgi:RHS repeat-associated protein|uniref:RHS repeat-associated core domain-containing protein n=1 Tax=Pseudomonas sp. GW101-3H06 TaxID=2751347 RepID=UPI001A93A8E0|nr:RHS repeat-associated core domain-containing protein [Pseudomonas sp. GW101-3H06]
MSRTPENLLIHYHYDALDRCISCVPNGQLRQNRFYQNERLATEVQGTVEQQIFQFEDVLLAELHKEGIQRTALLMTDKQRSVLQTTDGDSAYTPYGHRTVNDGLPSRLGFNGQRSEPVTEHYLLGNGHRDFSPVLMRFARHDRLSPFGEGGLNGYAYCGGDPINRTDPTGQTWYGWAWFANSALGMVDDYVIPRVPRWLARRIPVVANTTFGGVTKSMAKVGGFSASALYLVMNRVEAAFPLSPVNDPLFYAFLTTSTFATINSAAYTLHRLAVRGTRPLLPSTLPPLRRTASLPNLNTRGPVSTSIPDTSNLNMPLQQGEFKAGPNKPPNAISIRQAT